MKTMLFLDPGSVEGLPESEYQNIRQLVDVFTLHQSKNDTKDKYYEGHIPLSSVNLGIALPKGLRNLEIGCQWGSKCVDVLAARSMFDGFVSGNGTAADGVQGIVDRNCLITEYMKACRDELKYGCTFATLSEDDDGFCRIRFHAPTSAAALWDGQKGRIGCGLAILDTRKDESDFTWRPSTVAYYTDTDIWILYRDGTKWTAERHPHNMGRPLMEPMIWNATTDKPFGRSRIKEPIRKLIDGYVRTMADAAIAIEFDTTPQKYLMGVTDDQYDAIVSDKFKQYVGSLIVATTNPETGQNPAFGQLSQGNIEPHIQMIRLLATQFSAATGLSTTDTGIINDANPTSSDAILAQSQTLVMLAEQLNSGNGDALRKIIQMAQAIEAGTSLDGLTDDQKEVIAHFKNPAMPSIAATADAATKLAAVRSDFGATDVFLEMTGFDQADIRRIRAQEARARGTAVLSEEFAEDENNSESMESVQNQAGGGES